MKRIKFNQVCEDKRTGAVFQEDSIHELRDDSAMHWIKRGFAVEVFCKPEIVVMAPPVELVPDVADVVQEPESVDEKPQRVIRRGYVKRAVDPES